MRLSVQLDSETATALAHDGPKHGAAAALQEYLRNAGVELVPMHPGTDDPDLSTWFHASVPADRDAQEISRGLREHAAVLAAYLKPPEEPP